MTYTIRPRDSLSKIAKRFGVRLGDLLNANPGIVDPDTIRVGQRITIPDAMSPAPTPAAPVVVAGANDGDGADGSAGAGDGLVYSSLVSPVFCEKVIGIAARLGVDPNFLMAVMAFESGGTFSPSVKNKFSGATGLIQFMPKTAAGLGTSLAQLAQMTAEEQLEFVERHFRPFRGRLKTLEDTYMAVLLPVAVGKPNDHVLFRQGTKAYDQNKGLDVNRDGLITKAEAAGKVRAKLEAGRELVATGAVRQPRSFGPVPALRSRVHPTRAGRTAAGFDERAFVATVESANVDELLRILARPSAAEEQVLRVHLGDERYQRLHGQAVRQSSTRAVRAVMGNVAVIHGIMGSDLSSTSRDGDLDHVWVNVPRLILGRIERLLLNADATAEADSTYTVAATGIMKREYGDLLVRLAEHWNVQAFWFDWRKDLKAAADALHARLGEWFGDQPVHLVAHSMGGLVARTFIKKFPGRWAKMWDTSGNGRRGGRLVMLGTPNYGSFAIPQVFWGIEGLVQKLARFDVRHDLAELLTILNSFLGSYQMLPSPLKMKRMEPLYRAQTYGPRNVSQRHLDTARRHHEWLADVIDPKRMIYIAGDQEPTYCDLTDFNHPDLVEAYDVTTAGDGRVPHSLGLLSGVPTYYVDVDHGALVTSTKVLNVLDEVLESGATTHLSPARTRAADTPATKAAARRTLAERRRKDDAELEVLLTQLRGRASQASPLVSYDEHLAEQVLLRGFMADDDGGETVRVATERRDERTLSIEVAITHAGIDEIDTPSIDALAVGHYVDVRPQAAELALDRAITRVLLGKRRTEPIDPNDLLLTQLTERGTLRGELGRPFLLPDPRRPDGQRLVVIAGLGEPGRLGVPELTVLVRELCWVLGRMRKHHLATVLIGAGNGNLSIRDAFCCWMRGACRALAATPEGDEQRRVRRITFVEFDARRVLELERVLLAEKGDLAARYRLHIEHAALTGSKRNGLVQAARRKDREEAAQRWQQGRGDGDADAEPVRLTVGLTQSSYHFGAITASAAVPERSVPLDPQLVRDANDELVAERDRSRQVERGQFLQRLLFPSDLRPALSSSAPLVLLLDADTARIHWEMVAQAEIGALAADKQVDAFLGTSRGVTRQLRTVFAPPPQPPPPPRRTLRVLVVGDPADDAPLPGAQAEAQEVAALFEQFNHVQSDGGNRVEVVALIGPGEATRTNVLSRLMLETFDVLHYAGHCLYDKDNPPASGWIFSGGTHISASELSRLDRMPRFVFSNACESGITPERADQRSVGLAPSFAEAFFARGVANFVCTAWPVDDAAARQFALELYGRLLGIASGDHGSRPSDFARMHAAMREARLAIADTTAGYLTWGAYQHYGNPYFTLFERISAQTAAARSAGARRARSGRARRPVARGRRRRPRRSR
jgi:hypothetical protein